MYRRINILFSRMHVAAGMFFLLVCQCAWSQPTNSSELLHKKQLYLPSKVWMVPDSNDYARDTSRYNFSRMSESENIAVLWHKEFGADPGSNPDSTKRFKLDEVVRECERFYDFYVNKLKFVEKGHSVTDRKKALLFVIGGEEHTAFGGGEEDVGILWTPPVRMNKAPMERSRMNLDIRFNTWCMPTVPGPSRPLRKEVMDIPSSK